jgi:hypothetical protein
MLLSLGWPRFSWIGGFSVKTEIFGIVLLAGALLAPAGLAATDAGEPVPDSGAAPLATWNINLSLQDPESNGT